ncbi:hypothetical protein E2C01_063325 [Portunus trituberculatus]|uniref:Uncharacterized protein n=1 Tax=Portunus trituberculatus TaxID=210409 RepID=A0A5B7HA60_PORTR|nr:hypothetical protein [Portunus trituberculatus]
MSAERGGVLSEWCCIRSESQLKESDKCKKKNIYFNRSVSVCSGRHKAPDTAQQPTPDSKQAE